MHPLRTAPTRAENVGVLVKQCNLVYEKWHIKHWSDEEESDEMLIRKIFNSKSIAAAMSRILFVNFEFSLHTFQTSSIET